MVMQIFNQFAMGYLIGFAESTLMIALKIKFYETDVYLCRNQLQHKIPVCLCGVQLSTDA